MADSLMQTNDPSNNNEKNLLWVVVWSSAISVAISFGLLFSFHTNGAERGFKLTSVSILAFLIGIGLMWLFWKRVFQLLHDPKRMWRFITISSVLFVIAFIACIFLPQFTPTGTDNSELLQGMILGFIAVAAVFYLARQVMKMLEKADETPDDRRGS
jgi:Na+/proline symporter